MKLIRKLFNIGKSNKIKELLKEWEQLTQGTVDQQDKLPILDKILDADPKNSMAWHNKGTVLGGWEEYEESIRCLKNAVKYDPENQLAWFDTGFYLTESGNHEEAIKHYKKSLELDPTHQFSWYYKAESEYQLNRIKDALASYTKAERLLMGSAFTGHLDKTMDRIQEIRKNIN